MAAFAVAGITGTVSAKENTLQKKFETISYKTDIDLSEKTNKIGGWCEITVYNSSGAVVYYSLTWVPSKAVCDANLTLALISLM